MPEALFVGKKRLIKRIRLKETPSTNHGGLLLVDQNESRNEQSGNLMITGQYPGVVCKGIQTVCKIVEQFCEETELSIKLKDKASTFRTQTETDNVQTTNHTLKILNTKKEVYYFQGWYLLVSKLWFIPNVEQVIRNLTANTWHLGKVMGKNEV